jgi:hypothetical protein
MCSAEKRWTNGDVTNRFVVVVVKTATNTPVGHQNIVVIIRGFGFDIKP